MCAWYVCVGVGEGRGETGGTRRRAVDEVVREGGCVGGGVGFSRVCNSRGRERALSEVQGSPAGGASGGLGGGFQCCRAPARVLPFFFQRCVVR